MSDPTLSPVTVAPFLSVVEGRTPRQKIHKRLSDAKNAFVTPKHNAAVYHLQYGYPGRGYHTHGWGQIYEYSGTEWKLLYEVPQPQQKDMVKTEHRWGITYDWETRPWALEADK